MYGNCAQVQQRYLSVPFIIECVVVHHSTRTFSQIASVMMLRLSVIGALAATYAGVTQLFAENAPEAYMDEIFHVPQAQAYCRGEWRHWDDKITTLPGAYVVAFAHSRAAGFLNKAYKHVPWAQPNPPVSNKTLGHNMLGEREAGCSVRVLRSVNTLFALFSVLLLERFIL